MQGMLSLRSVAMAAASLICLAHGHKMGQEMELEKPMFGLAGEACGEDEYKRFKTIVCDLREACGCTETLCAQDWCNGYMRKWKKEFGACTAKGCPVEEGSKVADAP
eukprot:gb/GFBE01048183.1/.p1 GENE.gb/GFBE01048183.1/~~gb/GFBE01048183.1/.p1  ORF type:complete len:107 (+),score=31.72 gb/GFBE01048183.1/:1-321(+)